MFIQFLLLSFISNFKNFPFIYYESKHVSELANKLLICLYLHLLLLRNLLV